MIHGWACRTVPENMQILQFDICLLIKMPCNQFDGEGRRIETTKLSFKYVIQILYIMIQLLAGHVF